MTTIALIKREEVWVPAVIADIRVGDIYRLIQDGALKEIRTAHETPMPVILNGDVVGWTFKSEVVVR